MWQFITCGVRTKNLLLVNAMHQLLMDFFRVIAHQQMLGGI